jgi:oxygen-independent coproporphyrinogen-3 oxidase
VNLYVHVPFCARRCSYCDFAIAVRRAVPAAAFVRSVLQEWGWARQDAPWSEARSLRTLYLGGGTPSLLGGVALRELVVGLAREKPLAHDAEVTIEANPEDVTLDAALAWRDLGVTRVSLGVQSFDDRVLAWMHRIHSAAQVPNAVRHLRHAGITNLSLDLIFAVPRDLARDWPQDLARALDLGPEHISLYGLTVEPHTPLGRWTTSGTAIPAPEDQYAEEYLAAHATLHAAGFAFYEVSNASRPGFEAVHNGGYWRRAAFLGLGPSAHSGAGNRRWWNVRHWSAYQPRVSAGLSPIDREEVLSREAEGLERLYLGLRTSTGVEPRLLGGLADAWVRAGWAEAAGHNVRLTPEGWLRLDALAASVPA